MYHNKIYISDHIVAMLPSSDDVVLVPNSKRFRNNHNIRIIKAILLGLSNNTNETFSTSDYGWVVYQCTSFKFWFF